MGILPKQSLQEVKDVRCSLKYSPNNKLPAMNKTNKISSVDLSPIYSRIKFHLGKFRDHTYFEICSFLLGWQCIMKSANPPKGRIPTRTHQGLNPASLNRRTLNGNWHQRASKI
jgi:hypothetical protein